jgi:N-acetylmuramoyl-L-alanine amidase
MGSTNLYNGIRLGMDKYGGILIAKTNFIVIHHTAQDSIQTIKTFTLTRTQVSAHYVIADDGVVQMLNDYMRAWHAGNGSWGKILISTRLL